MTQVGGESDEEEVSSTREDPGTVKHFSEACEQCRLISVQRFHLVHRFPVCVREDVDVRSERDVIISTQAASQGTIFWT